MHGCSEPNPCAGAPHAPVRRCVCVVRLDGEAPGMAGIRDISMFLTSRQSEEKRTGHTHRAQRIGRTAHGTDRSGLRSRKTVRSKSMKRILIFGFAALILFFIVHVAMVVATGFGQQLRAMTWGK